MDIAKKTALITGTARGIGQAIAVALAQAGANIIAVDLPGEEQQETVDRVEARGVRCSVLAADVTIESSVRRMLDEAFVMHGGCDILINNAGILLSGPFEKRDFEEWRRVIEVDLLAVMRLTHAIVPLLRQRGGGHIVNLASVAGIFGTEGLAVYGAAKHGVVGFSSALRAELADANIGVSWICPSFVQTRLVAGIARSWITPMLHAEDVARAVRRAIERNASEVILPRHLRFAVAMLPSIFPNFARRLSGWIGASRGWFTHEAETP